MTDREILELILSKVNSMEIDIKLDIAELKHDVAELKSDVAILKLVVENELRINIQRVAEGHLDLSRNLKESQKSNNEFEMLSIRVGTLESQVKEINRKIS